MADPRKTDTPPEDWAEDTARSPDDQPGREPSPGRETTDWAAGGARSPDDAGSGDEPMTEAQALQLRRLAEQAGVAAEDNLTRDQADRVIADLAKKAG
jgi:hypothetical protein